MMAGSVNRVILIGNVGADPDVRRTQDGKAIVNIRLATSEQWRDKNSGDRREKTEWHTIVVFAEGLAKVAEAYVKKGSKIYVEGSLQTRKWQDQSGNDRYSTEVVLNGFNSALTLLDGPADNGSRDTSAGDYAKASGGERRQSPSQQAARTSHQAPLNYGHSDLDDSDIPF